MLQFLFSPTKQFLYDSGKLLAGGKIYVYLKDTQILATLYDGETGEGKSNPIILDANGRASVKADDVNEYRLEIYTPYDTLVYTCNAFYAEGGEGGGTFIVRHDDTLSGNGTSQNPLSVVNIPLAVDDTMTAYTDIVDGVSSLVLGVNGDWFNDTFGSALNDKVDWSSFSSCCSSVKEELGNKLDSSSFDLSNYYNKQETNNLFENYYNKQEIDETVNVINELKQDKLTFDYNENSAISAINGSALAGQGGEGSCPWITGGKEITNTQTLTGDMIVQVLSSFTLSGDHNHFISVKGGVYRFPNKWEIASGIAETNYFMPQSGMSSYLPMSSFSSYTASIQNNLNTNWDYTNSAYSLSINNFHNKLDVSAFSSWSATYSGNSEVNNYVTNNSSFIDDSVNVVQNNSGKWNEIEVYEQNSGTYLTAHQTIPSSKWENASDVVQTNSAHWANNDSNTAVNNWVQQNSATVDMVTLGYLTNEANWNDTYYTVMTNSANWSGGGNPFPITGTNGTTAYTHGADCSSFYLSNTVDRAGSVVTFSNNALNFAAYPSTDVSASWYNIINGANNRSNCYCIRFTDDMTAASLEDYSAYDKVTVVHSNQYKPNCVLHWNGYTKTFPSGVYCEMVKGTNDLNQTDWFFTNSGRMNNLEWDN